MKYRTDYIPFNVASYYSERFEVEDGRIIHIFASDMQRQAGLLKVLIEEREPLAVAVEEALGK